MNANELADNLNDWRPRTSPAGFKLLDDAATMLRQQQADKEQLEFALINSETAYEKQQAEIEVLKETLQGRDRYIDLLMEAQEK